MTRKILYASLALAFGLTVVGTLAACTLTAEEKADLMVTHITRQLDLNENQVAILEEIKTEALKIRAQNREQHHQRAQEMVAMIQSDQLDQEKLNGWVDEKLEMVDQHAPWFIGKVAELHATLSSEQKAEITEHIEDMHQLAHGRSSGHFSL